MKKTILSVMLGLILTAIFSPVISYAMGCFGMMQAVDPETGEIVNCYKLNDTPPCRYRCPFGDIEQ